MTLPIRNSRVRTTQGTFFWREVGRGPTVLMLHGSWTDGNQWLPLMAQLGTHFHCLAPDLLGFGESSRLPHRSYSIDAEVAALHDYLAQLRASPRVIVADTLGAWIAMRYCLQYPDQVQQLVLLAPEGLSHPRLRQRWGRYRWLAKGWAIRYWVVRGLAPVIRLLGGDRWLKSTTHQRQLLRRNTAACRLLFQRRKTALQAEYLNEVLPQLTTPLLLLHPELASDTTSLIHQRVQELIPGAQVRVVAGDELTLWETAAPEIQSEIQARFLDAIAP